MAARKMTKAEMKALVAKAEAAAVAAFNQCQPQGMVVQQRARPAEELLGLGDGGPVVKEYVVPDGPCGFAWVNVKPGNSRFANYLRNQGKGRTDSYYGGLTVWYSDLGIPSSQSYQRNLAAAGAYAKVLAEAGINAYSTGRLD